MTTGPIRSIAACETRQPAVGDSSRDAWADQPSTCIFQPADTITGSLASHAWSVVNGPVSALAARRSSSRPARNARNSAGAGDDAAWPEVHGRPFTVTTSD